MSLGGDKNHRGVLPKRVSRNIGVVSTFVNGNVVKQSGVENKVACRDGKNLSAVLAVSFWPGEFRCRRPFRCKARAPHYIVEVYPAAANTARFHGAVRLLSEIGAYFQSWRKELEKGATNG
jgi:hypothetical protein